MQLFNGITMGVFDFYRARYNDNGPEAPKDLGDTSKDQGKLREEVVQLTDKDGNSYGESNDVVEGLGDFLNLQVADYFSKHIDAANKLIKVIEDYKERKINDIAPGVEDVYKFLKSIVEHTSFNFDTGVVNQPVQSEEQESALIDMIKIDQYAEEIDDLLKNPSLDVDVKKTLVNISAVLKNTNNKGYVMQLQQYFYDNIYFTLKGSEYNNFLRSNGTLDGNTLKFQGNGNISGLLESKALDVIINRVKASIQSMEVDGVVYQRTNILAKGMESVSLYGLEPSLKQPGFDNSPDQSKNNIANLRIQLDIKDGEEVYFMKVGEKKYAVKLDGERYLCPIAIDVDNNETVFFGNNNPSCIKYLEKKIPSGVKRYSPNVQIVWNGERYVIGIPGTKMLTIEPMTMDGKWVSKDLGECLAMLSFVNYLRNSEGIQSGGIDYKFKNDNPDLDWDDDDGGKLLVKIEKDKRAKKDSGEKDKAVVDLDRFGLLFLKNVESDVRKNFIKYNNGEHREDNWKKKKENDYESVDLVGDIEKSQNVPTTPEARPQGAGASSRGGGGTGGDSRTESLSKYSFSNSLGNWSDAQYQKQRGLYGIQLVENTSLNVYQIGGTPDEPDLCYQRGNDIVKISHDHYWKKEIGTGDINKNQFTKSKEELNVCERGAKQLNKVLETVVEKIYRDIYNEELEDLSLDGMISVENDKYVLNYNNNSIPLNEVIFSENDGKFCGFDNEQLTERLKIAWLAVEHYNQITDENRNFVITDKEKKFFGINGQDDVKNWVNKLISGNYQKECIVLPGRDQILVNNGIGTFDRNGGFKLNNNAVNLADGRKYIELNGKRYYENDAATGGLCYIVLKDGIYLGEHITKAQEGFGIVVVGDESKDRERNFKLNTNGDNGISDASRVILERALQSGQS